MVYKLPFSCTKISKLIFQFKLLHRPLATNHFLNKIGIRPDDLCTFCRDEREPLIHLFWSSRETNFFWRNFQGWLFKNLISLKPKSSLSSAAVFGLKANFFSNTKQYFYFLVARYYIWTCRTLSIYYLQPFGNYPQTPNVLCWVNVSLLSNRRLFPPL